ncbi:MAG: hypothetical protein HN580_10995 [Deltaproteobacteria bacterium]|nr:hypothetical protein [Deltaproteobacteria bacterium]MBT4268350.1 hypothetical protein [Deltaproteobacteria bacterium]MBT4640716.1 hypothetical protein [Deltaproteobacteria bacterium]MBT6614133.1 hypothetical protein [Deltaproteobacteria bacterium]MBT7714263.1 hypothetical protein [Deltaproteobacteria bacterium]
MKNRKWLPEEDLFLDYSQKFLDLLRRKINNSEYINLPPRPEPVLGAGLPAQKTVVMKHQFDALA